MQRGDYDHNHTLLSAMTTNNTLTIIVIVLAVIILGGLSVGLFILDKF